MVKAQQDLKPDEERNSRDKGEKVESLPGSDNIYMAFQEQQCLQPPGLW